MKAAAIWHNLCPGNLNWKFKYESTWALFHRGDKIFTEKRKSSKKRKIAYFVNGMQHISGRFLGTFVSSECSTHFEHWSTISFGKTDVKFWKTKNADGTCHKHHHLGGFLTPSYNCPANKKSKIQNDLFWLITKMESPWTLSIREELRQNLKKITVWFWYNKFGFWVRPPPPLIGPKKNVLMAVMANGSLLVSADI